MTLSRARVFAIVVIAAVIVASLIAFMSRRSPAPSLMSLSFGFAGFSTNVATGVLAVFTISNRSPWEVAYRAGLPQVRSNGSWSPVQITEGEMKSILAGQTASFLIPLPATSGVWRVPVVYCRPRNQVELLFGRIWQKTARAVGRHPPGLGVPCETNFTPEISR